MMMNAVIRKKIRDDIKRYMDYNRGQIVTKVKKQIKCSTLFGFNISLSIFGRKLMLGTLLSLDEDKFTVSIASSLI